MSTNPNALADKIVAMAEDGLRPLDRTIASWPGEFKAIIWQAVVEIATRRAEEAKQTPG